MFFVMIPAQPSRRAPNRAPHVRGAALWERHLPAALLEPHQHDAQPARAIRSAVAPNHRDESSDLYRKQENVNLLLNIKASGVLGKGFGIPINYSQRSRHLGHRSADRFDPAQRRALDMAPPRIQGEMAFWCLIVAVLIQTCALRGAKDKRLRCFGSIVACATVAYTLMGYNDLGSGWFRIAVVMGTLLGAMEAAHRLVLNTRPTKVAAEPVTDPSAKSSLEFVLVSDDA